MRQRREYSIAGMVGGESLIGSDTFMASCLRISITPGMEEFMPN